MGRDGVRNVAQLFTHRLGPYQGEWGVRGRKRRAGQPVDAVRHLSRAAAVDVHAGDYYNNKYLTRPTELRAIRWLDWYADSHDDMREQIRHGLQDGRFALNKITVNARELYGTGDIFPDLLYDNGGARIYR